jgi:hypothetical protein
MTALASWRGMHRAWSRHAWAFVVRTHFYGAKAGSACLRAVMVFHQQALRALHLLTASSCFIVARQANGGTVG